MKDTCWREPWIEVIAFMLTLGEGVDRRGESLLAADVFHLRGKWCVKKGPTKKKKIGSHDPYGSKDARECLKAW